MSRLSISASCAIFVVLFTTHAPRARGQANPPAPDLFASDVRSTPWLAPEDERKSFTLPPGFVATCFAHEPDLFKPMNMAFDARGRLWCTNSTEYPYPVRADKKFVGRDRITILEDTDGDSVADKVTVFADGLDIPIGLLPMDDGCIVFSIPDIWRLRDTDSDDQADTREILYGPMGWERDTHGLNNSFRRGPDGWVYANHGYNNHTRVKGSDGHEIYMESGNSYRFKVDGSRIEQFSFGQVNPFGSAFSPLGDLYTADCHTLPITVLLREGCYDSFGRPHDGLGYASMIMHHLHGSTALCGLAYEENGWLVEFRDNIFVGNVMTCRVHRDLLVFDGSTPKAVEQHDLIETSDPWFRPVDLQLAPDGALYVADFYNRIIGHYEVPLDHPGRDRASGRIWRIAYAGAGKNAPRVQAPPNLRTASPDALIVALAHPQQSVRMRALDELTDRLGRAAVPALQEGFLSAEDANARALCLWGLFRLDALPPGLLHRAAGNVDRRVRVHARRVLSETRAWNEELRELALSSLEDDDAFVRRAAADALSTHADPRNVAPLLALMKRTPAGDELLRHVAKIALRDQLRDDKTIAALRTAKLADKNRRLIAAACMGVVSEPAGGFLLDEVERGAGDSSIDRKTVAAQLGHAADLVARNELARLAQIARARFADDPTFELELIQQVQAGLDRRALPPVETVSQ